MIIQPLKIPSWDELFMSDVYKIARKSKDNSSKIGAVLVKNNINFSSGYNGMARGVDDNKEERYERPEKYFWMSHAERNACYNCARHGRATLDSVMYTPSMPCTECADAIIQCGIIEVILHKQSEEIWNSLNPKWIESAKRSTIKFQEAGVNVRYFDGILGVQTLVDKKIFNV